MAINQLLRDVQGKEEENIIKQVAIRSMAKAVYSTENIGHYGLSFEHYAHFTSPIRRYPDLMVHRAMAHYLAGGKALNKDELELSCKHSSQMEKQASDAERAASRSANKRNTRLLASAKRSKALSAVLPSWGIYVGELERTTGVGLIGLRALSGDVFRFPTRRTTALWANALAQIPLGR